VTWTGAGMFDHRRPLPVLLFGGAIFWIVVSRLPAVANSFELRVLLSVSIGIVISHDVVLDLSALLAQAVRRSIVPRTPAAIAPRLRQSSSTAPAAAPATLAWRRQRGRNPRLRADADLIRIVRGNADQSNRSTD
jgi:hypothetical protein